MTEEINQEDFLSEYLEDKQDWMVLDSIDNDSGDWIEQHTGNDFFNVSVFEEKNAYWCEIISIEISHATVARFMFPATYQEFKTLMDIFLKTGI